MKIYNELQQQYEKYGNVQNLMKYINIDTLFEKHHEMKSTKAAGIDKVSKSDYEINLDENIQSLVSRLKAGTYEPLAIRRCYIPKANGKLRPLGIPAYEDKLMQAVMSDILCSIYEPIFLDCSNGYRNNRNCHTALLQLSKIVQTGHINYIVEADIKGFFDNLNHTQLLNLLKQIIQDRHFIRYIKKFIQADIYYDGSNSPSIAGTPQGGAISPALANIYLHYVLDSWFENCIKPTCSNSHLIRYCDDFIACFSNKRDAEYFYTAVQTRLTEYSLEIEPTKTKILRFNIYDPSSEHFAFLGFNISVNVRKELCLETSNNKLISKLGNINNKIIDTINTTNSIVECIQEVNALLRGVYNYYGFHTNELWLHELYTNTLDNLIDILCVNNTTKCISVDELNDLLLIYPISTPPDHLIIP